MCNFFKRRRGVSLTLGEADDGRIETALKELRMTKYRYEFPVNDTIPNFVEATANLAKRCESFEWYIERLRAEDRIKSEPAYDQPDPLGR